MFRFTASLAWSINLYRTFPLPQVWFHNEEFRSALYSWVPLDDETEGLEKDSPQMKMEIDGQCCSVLRMVRVGILIMYSTVATEEISQLL